MALRPDLLTAQADNLELVLSQLHWNSWRKFWNGPVLLEAPKNTIPAGRRLQKLLHFICPLMDIITKTTQAYKSHLPFAAGSLQGQCEHNTSVWYNYFL